MKIFERLTAVFFLMLGLAAIPVECNAQCGIKYNYQNGDLHYRLFQNEENPMFLEIVEDESHANLRSVTIPDELMIEGDVYYEPTYPLRPAVVEKIGAGAFRRARIESIEIPSSVKRIGMEAFYYSHLKNVQFSEGLVSIGEFAFGECRFISVRLPESLRFMEFGCFSGCDMMEEVYLPSNLVSMGGFTFRFCGNLKDIYCSAKIPPLAEDTDFGVIHNTRYPQIDRADGPSTYSCVLHVPAGSEEAYRNAPGWRVFDNIVAIENIPSEIEEIAGEENVFEYHISDGTLTVPCKANDIVGIYDAAGVCLKSSEISSPCDYRYSGKGIHIVSLNGKSVKVNL